MVENRDELMNNGVNYASEIFNDICNDLQWFAMGIVIDRQRRPKKKKQMDVEGSRDAELPFYTEFVQINVFIAGQLHVWQLDNCNIQEITLRFQQLHELAGKYAFIFPPNLLDDKYECQIDHDHNDINKEEFLNERKRLQSLIAIVVINDETQTWKEGQLQLLKFIQKNNHGNSVPNIVIRLRIFLTISVSVATCEMSFSKLKLIKNYLISTMSTLRLRNLAMLSMEQQLTDEIKFENVIEEFASKKARKINL